MSKYSQISNIYLQWAKEFSEPETQIGLIITRFFNFEIGNLFPINLSFDVRCARDRENEKRQIVVK